MSFSTVYDVKVRYSVDNRAGNAVGALSDDTRKLGREVEHTTGKFMAMGAAVVAALTGREAKKALLDFNSGVESAKIGLSAMIQGNTGGTWDRAIEKAGKLYDEFQSFSQMTPVTTAEMLTFGKAVAVSTFQAGGAIKDLTTITEQGVVAAKAFGYESAYSSLELSEMLAGNVNKRMMFAKQLLGMAHMDEQKFNALTAEKRLQIVEDVLNSPAMKNAAEAFSKSWVGVMSTLEDKLQIVLGKVGLPLFEAIKNEIKGWNDWLDQNKHKVEEIAHKVGSGLITGFGYVKDAVAFLVDHASELMAIGKIWLAVQVGGMMSSLVKGGTRGAGMLGDLRAWMAPARDRFNPETGDYEFTKAGAGRTNVTLGNVAGSLPLLAQSAALGYAFGSIVSEATGLKDALHDLAIGETGRQFEKINRAADALTQALQRAADAAPKQAAASTNLTGSANLARTMGNLAADAAREENQGTYSEGGYVPSDIYTQKMRALSQIGIGDEEISKAGGLQKFADEMNARAKDLADRQAALQQTGNDAWEYGFGALTDYQRQTLDTAKAQQDLLAYINSHGMKIDPKTIVEILRADTDDPEGKHKKLAEKPNVNVHIQRIEVQSDDPDRMAFGLIEFFRDAAKNPSSAVSALREG